MSESHFEVRRAREMLERWRERAARAEARKRKDHRPTFDEEQHQKDIGYLLLVITNLESGYYTMKKTEEEIEAARQRSRVATANAKKILKPGDKIRVERCCYRKTTITFAGWNGNWIISKSGIAEYSASTVDRLNGRPVDFTQPHPHDPHHH